MPAGVTGCRVVVNGLGHRFDSGWLFRGLNLELAPGCLVGICGPSGSGKTTLLAIVSGWLKPIEGAVYRPGVRRVAWVFQNPHGVAQRMALDHVALPLLAQGESVRAAESRALELMTGFGLIDVAHRPFSALSGGEAQRLMLARAVATHPDVLLIDEPTAQLDRAAAARVNQTISHVADTGSIVIIASHDPETIAVCNQIIDLGLGAL
jgi:ABC-type lipoprotein export system ATPase subunit